MPADTPSSQYVNDLKSRNSKQLLNAYVYDFLIKSSLPKTAQSFVKEAEVPTGPPTTKSIKRPPQKDLLPLAISLDAPQGFLYEWWQIFWDVFNARTHRGGSENAQHYYQLQLLKQHKEHSLHSSTFQAAHAQAQLQAQMAQSQAQAYGQMSIENIPQQQQQLFLQQQYQQQVLLMQYQQQQNRNYGQLGMGVPQQQLSQQGLQATFNNKSNVPGLQQQQQFNQIARSSNDGSINGATPVPLSQMSPHLQQPQTPLDPQQYYQQQQIQQQQQQLYPGQKRGGPPVGSGVVSSGNGPINPSLVRVQQAQLQMNQFRQQQAYLPQAQFPGQGQNIPFKPPVANQTGTINAQNSSKRSNTPNKKIKLDERNQKGSPLAQSPHTKDLSSHNSPIGTTKLNGANIPSPLISQTIKEELNESSLGSGQSALQDYQKQLMLLESENKKMLNGSKKESEASSANSKKEKPKKKMPPPKKVAKSSSPGKSSAATPLIASVTVNSTSTSSRKKKETVNRRRSKKNSNSEPPTPTTPLTPNPLGNNTTNMAMLKKDSSAVSKLAGIEENPTSKDKVTPSNSSQLTPPISENAINSNNDASSSEINNAGNIMNPIGTDDHFPTDDEIIGGSQFNGSSNDVYSDFGLSEFSNEISGDGNFNLETFLNTDGAEIGSFDNYWRDGVEATD